MSPLFPIFFLMNEVTNVLALPRVPRLVYLKIILRPTDVPADILLSNRRLVSARRIRASLQDLLDGGEILDWDEYQLPGLGFGRLIGFSLDFSPAEDRVALTPDVAPVVEACTYPILRKLVVCAK